MKSLQIFFEAGGILPGVKRGCEIIVIRLLHGLFSLCFGIKMWIISATTA
jgi:hypothetical protein